MKNTDIALVVLLAAVSVLVSYWVVGLFMGNPDDATFETRYVQRISGSLEQPDEETFNPTMINPTEEIYIGKCDPTTEVEDPDTHQCLTKSEYEKKINGGDKKDSEDKDKDANNEDNQDNSGTGNDNSES